VTGWRPAHNDLAGQSVSLDALEGWDLEDHAGAFEAWRGFGNRENRGVDAADAKDFFQRSFLALKLGSGLLTGYFEPELDASPVKSMRFGVPLYARPPDMEKVQNLDRAQFEAGALAGRGLEIAWIEDPVDAFFVHVQGSVRLNMTNGETWRLAWDGRNAHPYSSIGAILIESGEVDANAMSMQRLRTWLGEDRARARALMARNRSYIFFRRLADRDEAPVGSAGRPLVAGRSLAVDLRHHRYGTPIWVATRTPFPGSANPLCRMTIAADSGSAVRGRARGDLYCGSGAPAGEVAGRLRHECTFFALLPRKSEWEWQDAVF
jgi:peptidoglycan lytic transglycosylase A